MKNYNYYCSVFIILCITISCAFGEDIFLQIFLKKPVNVVSENFVSFSIDPDDLLDIVGQSSNGSITKFAKEISPGYLKIAGRSTNNFMIDGNGTVINRKRQSIIDPADLLALSNWMRLTNLQPIIALPYNPNNWNPRDVIKVLGIADKLGIKDCIWQLGSEFSTSNAINYVDDLTTLRNIVDAIGNGQNRWSVIGADISSISDKEEARLYAELSQHIVKASGWEQSFYEESSMERDRFVQDYKQIFRNFLRDGIPIWTSLPSSQISFNSNGKCSQKCITNSLQWAHNLGESAQNGFNVLFKQISKSAILNPQSFDYYITILYKKLLGEKVFDTNLVYGNQKAQQSYFAHCTRDMSGSFTVMGVNFAKTKSKVISKLQNRYTGVEILEYIITIDEDGTVMLNGYPIDMDSVMQPNRRMKRSNRPLNFALPPLSVGFWTFPLASLKECMHYTDFDDMLTSSSNIVVERRPMTTSELLLQQLIRESAAASNSSSVTLMDQSKNRQRRHLVVKKDSNHLNRSKRDLTDNSIFTKQLSSNYIDIDSGEAVKRDYRKVPDNEIHQRAKRTLKAFGSKSHSGNSLESSMTPRKGFYVPNAATESRLTKRGLFGKKRPKRQVNALTKLFEKFEFKKPLGLSRTPLFNLGPSAIPPVSTVHDVFKVTSNENLFISSENTDFPHGDVYFEIEQGTDEFMAYDENGKPLEKVNDDFVLDIPDDVRLQKAPEFVDYYTDMSGRQLPNVAIPLYGELWEADVYQKSPPPDMEKSVSNQDMLTTVGNGKKENKVSNIEFVVKELEPTWKKNQENLLKARENMQNYYVRDYDRTAAVRNLKYFSGNKGSGKTTIDLDDDDDERYYSRRHRRSVSDHSIINQENKSEISSKDNAAAEVFDHNENVDRSQINRLGLIGRITNILKSIEKIDDVNDHESVVKFSDDVRDLEDFIIKRMPRLRLFRHDTQQQQQQQQQHELANKNELRRKCKIISLNLEQQCLRDDDLSIGRTFGKREAKYIDELKSKKSIKEKKSIKIKKSIDSTKNIKPLLSRSKRSPNAWEIDAVPNGIPKEFYSDTDLGSNIFQQTPVSFNTIISSSKQDSVSRGDKTTTTTTTTTETNNGIAQSKWKEDDQHVYQAIIQPTKEHVNEIKVLESNNIGNDYKIETDYDLSTIDIDSPKFMKIFTGQIHGLLDFLNRHVADWWHWMS